MILITSPGRGYFMVGPGYSYKVRNGEDLAAAVLHATKTLAGNDRQVDLWNAQALQGTVAGVAAAPSSVMLTDDQLQLLRASVGGTTLKLTLTGEGVPE